MTARKKILPVLLISLLSTQVYSQISLGGGLSSLHLIDENSTQTYGLGFKVDYALTDLIVLYGGSNYYFQSSHTEFYYGNAVDNQTSPRQIIIEVETTISFIQFFAGAKRYILGDYEGGFGIYGLAEAGFLLAPLSVTVEDYDRSIYHTGEEEGGSQTLARFAINLGGGAEKEFDFGYLFCDLKFIIPYTGEDGIIKPNEIPLSASASVGLRVPF